MDPFLEDAALWPLFQHQLTACLYQILLPGLVDRYRARISERKYVTEQALFTSVIREAHTEESIEICQRSDGRLVTMIEIVSPANKTTPEGRAAYLECRREGRLQNAGLVEIDLVLAGQPMLDYSREELPEYDFVVTVTRAAHPERFEIYTTTLQKRLPRFKIPLAGDDRDTVLDLQASFARTFDQGNFSTQIDYRKHLAAPLSEEDQRWVDDWLTQLNLR